MFPEPTNITRPYQLFGYANTLTNGMFGTVIIVMVFIIAFVTLLSQRRTSVAFASASFISLIMALILRGLAAVSDYVVIVALVFNIMGLAFIIYGND